MRKFELFLISIASWICLSSCLCVYFSMGFFLFFWLTWACCLAVRDDNIDEQIDFSFKRAQEYIFNLFDVRKILDVDEDEHDERKGEKMFCNNLNGNFWQQYFFYFCHSDMFNIFFFRWAWWCWRQNDITNFSRSLEPWRCDVLRWNHWWKYCEE